MWRPPVERNTRFGGDVCQTKRLFCFHGGVFADEGSNMECSSSSSAWCDAGESSPHTVAIADTCAKDGVKGRGDGAASFCGSTSPGTLGDWLDDWSLFCCEAVQLAKPLTMPMKVVPLSSCPLGVVGADVGTDTTVGDRVGKDDGVPGSF
mmetsp:Transcript_21622/g.57411  ORF Transcript_21622/g.57411 Transcript_21622/m.57411 type:complete len:150 (+) Transcript_21622:158-607(+)